MAEDWLRAALADGARPFRYRGGVRALLGFPDDTAVALTFPPRPPRGGFPSMRRWSGPVEQRADNPGWAAAEVLDVPPTFSRSAALRLPGGADVTEFPASAPATPARRDPVHAVTAEPAEPAEPAAPAGPPALFEFSIPGGASPSSAASSVALPAETVGSVRPQPQPDPAQPAAPGKAAQPGAGTPATSDSPPARPGPSPQTARLGQEPPPPVHEAVEQPSGVAHAAPRPIRPGRAAVPAPPEVTRLGPPAMRPSEETSRPMPGRCSPEGSRPRSEAAETARPSVVEPVVAPDASRLSTRAIRPTATGRAEHPGLPDDGGRAVGPPRPAIRRQLPEPSPQPRAVEPPPIPPSTPPQVVVRTSAPVPAPPADVAAFWERRYLRRFLTRVIR